MASWQDINAKINAVPYLAEEVLAPTGDGNLRGLTMSIKDSFEVAGMPTTAGSPTMKDYMSKTDAIAVARLRAAGAAILGKSNLPLFAGDWQSFNDVYGQSNNPHNLDCTPGGSSGGAAAALAAGLTDIELGSDLAGSIRLPSHFCGIFGLKPSYGVVPVRGHVPPPPGMLSEAPLSVAGPMARNAALLEKCFDAITTPVEGEDLAFAPVLKPARIKDVSSLRLSLWLDDDACPVDDMVRKQLEQAADKLVQAGATIVDSKRPVTFDQAYDAFFPAMVSIVAAGFPPVLIAKLRQQAEAADPADNSPAVAYARAATMAATDLARNTEKRLQQRAKWNAFFQDVDLVLCPAAPVTAIPHDHSQPAMARTISINDEDRHYFDVMKWIATATAADLPSVVVPTGLAENGMPVGLQAFSGHMMDRDCLAFAHIAEQVLGGVPKPALFHDG